MKPKLTSWYPPHTKPVRKGVYETDAEGHMRLEGAHFQYWNGREWGAYDVTPERAKLWGGSGSHYQNVNWRGLTAQGGKQAPR